ncbi:MCE family protein [Phycicoccus duodecadis]|uniref:Phospholipid/cholesterol/gamma-HCH transport system substrate-binding protein n=1 Tax=Phycicoccus duodecadis TaxID=173053 RepID=A0A2N3YHI2_9MICO|nr:MCE family protein [Phycicoccus duodecadis]PKW26305.1 phospholipid/cholesterol/gamma-HCH transport system substrate-binding protein [Phycicoccus duodecadis]
MARIVRPPKDRNTLRFGIAGLAVIAVLMVLAFNASRLPFLGGGPAYSAAFTEAGGLRDGDDVRIAGVKVGDVTGVDLEGSHVRVDFRITGDVSFGPQTAASVRIKTLLGAKYVALEPRGTGQLKEGSQIPLERTVSSYDVISAFSDLTKTTERIDTDQLARSLDVLATEFKDTPANVRTALDGLSRLSRTVASRDEKLRELLRSANTVTGTVAEQNAAIDRLMQDADLLLVELEKRREAIHTLFTNTSALAQQITGLVRDNRAELGPALAQLKGVLATLQKHEADLQATIEAMAPFTRVFANTLGTGRWFDTYIQNLTVPVGSVGR